MPGPENLLSYYSGSERLIFPRRHFFSLCCRLASSRLRTAACDGVVAIRFFFVARVRSISANIRPMALSLFVTCERVSCEVMTNSPPVVSFLAKRIFSAGVSSAVACTFHRTSTRVLTLFACCPPGPLLRTAEMVSSGKSFSLAIFRTPVYQLVWAISWAAFSISRRLICPKSFPFSTIGKRRTGEFRNAFAASTTSLAGERVCTLRVM